MLQAPGACLMTSDVLYRPQNPVREGTGFLYFPASSTLQDLSYEPGLAQLLAEWDRFESIDRVLVRALGGTDFQQAARDVRVLNAGPKASWAARQLARVFLWADRRQAR